MSLVEFHFISLHCDLLATALPHAHMDACDVPLSVNHIMTNVNLCHDLPTDSFCFLLFPFYLAFHLVMKS